MMFSYSTLSSCFKSLFLSYFPCLGIKRDGDFDSHGGPFYSNESNEDDEVFADPIPADILTHTAPLLTEAPSTLHPNFSTSDSNSLSLVNVHGKALSCSHSTLSSSLQTDDNGFSPYDVSASSSRHCSLCNRNNANSNQVAHQNLNMTSQSTDNDRDRLENDQPLASHRRLCSSDTDDDDRLGGDATSGQDSVASGNQLAVTKKRQPPPKGQRKRPPRKTIDHTGGVLATTFMLSSFTFCALCIDTSPEIFIVAVFMAAFMFQVIQQLNSM